ncbi:hypothetical protein MOKP126_18010 [Mycobacterium avium subsp. hominissuis]
MVSEKSSDASHFAQLRLRTRRSISAPPSRVNSRSGHSGTWYCSSVGSSARAWSRRVNVDCRNAAGCGELISATADTSRACSSAVAQQARPPSAWPTSVAEECPSARISPAASPDRVQPS